MPIRQHPPSPSLRGLRVRCHYRKSKGYGFTTPPVGPSLGWNRMGWTLGRSHSGKLPGGGDRETCWHNGSSSMLDDCAPRAQGKTQPKGQSWGRAS